jgi:hypothetical protein
MPMRGSTRPFRRTILAIASAAPLLTVGAAPAEVSLAYGGVMEKAARLRPGEFLWLPQIAPAGPMLMVVSLATQRAIVYRNGVPIAASSVSTGKEGKRTPAGIFTILQKRAQHSSNIYSNAPMPFMQRLTWTGIALHGGALPGYPASHGCIRLPMAFARNLFALTKLGMTVVVTRDAAVPHIAAPPLMTTTPGGTEAIPSGAYEWYPERSAEGPVSIMVSGADRRVTVLRNGVEIGRAAVGFEGDVVRTTAYSLQHADARGQRWMRLPLPGQSGKLQAAEWQRFRVPSAFKRVIAGVATPGTTVIVTADSLRANGVTKTATILEGDQIG